jgi:hypothetical protein
LSAFQYFVFLNPHVTFANNLCLNLSAAFAKQLVSQSTYDCDLHIRKQLVSQALQAIVTSSAFCKQLISQDPYVIVTTYNLQLTTLMHVQTCSTKSKLPRIAQLEPSHNQFQTQTWVKCNHLRPDLLLLQQRMELPRTQSQPGSTRHSNCKKMHGCMTHSFDSWESQRIMPSIKECCPVVVNVIRESGVCLQGIKKMAGRSLHAHGVSRWLLLQSL